jgi:hypothetical protein
MWSVVFFVDFVAATLVTAVAVFKLANAISPVVDRANRQLHKRQFDLVMVTSIFISLIRMSCSAEPKSAASISVSMVSCVVIMAVDIRDVVRISKFIKPS